MRAFCLALAALVSLSAAGWSQEPYPSRPVRLVVPYPPGGTTDIVGRLIAQRLAELWGQQVVVDNRAGASGTIGSDLVARAEPNGLTLVLGNSASHGAAELLSPTTPYKALVDFAPITMLATVRQVLVVHPSVPARSVRELIQLARAKPGALNYGSSAIGGAPHLAAELFKMVAGVDIVHVPYRGAAPAAADLLSGQINLMFASAPTVAEQVRGGRLVALAVASDARTEMLPEVPTMAEAGQPGVVMDSWFGLLAPAATPPTLTRRIAADVAKVTDGEEMRRKMADLGFERLVGTPDGLAAFMREEQGRVGRVIREAGIKGE